MKTLVTGEVKFIRDHLFKNDHEVIGIDNINNCY